eukprot:CAMPEP_0204645948 /NCGR_PEP_ID=MMETSP0718-20130828/3771_1 /ASSEMBLY_ACC=CAM_ASM_000674 /TAXON_ID=230516 /ORGANISM="Chaetoceros curvisetus" /LENGTH=447 /DNA_ID=CAMNT_0051668043 /DNA_START=257 /DNA_END=1600 /DNA_ORIENTATION=+
MTISSSASGEGEKSSSPISIMDSDDNKIQEKQEKVSKTATAKLISISPQSMKEAGERIRSGHLVSFPTETVYGLGCHAIDPTAVKRVFEAKERPLTDPLIVHVNEATTALNLWDASSSSSSSSAENLEQRALQALTDGFWPGPLTIVARASPTIPSIIMAGTGYVACRSPSHPIARSLIDASGVPIAAPSANKFGHVSPTRAEHVMDDLGMEDVWIVDPDLDVDDNVTKQQVDVNKDYEDDVICDVGVESTVAKVEMESEHSGIIAILRHGAVSSQDIYDCLQSANLLDNFQVKEKMQSTGENVSHVAPGQTIRHYSPNVQSFMVSQDRYSTSCNNLWTDEELAAVKTAVIIDFGGRLSSLKEHSLAYRDLSVEGDSNKAAANVFASLRWSETIDGAEQVFFPELRVDETDLVKEALVLAVKDRLTRAASGVVVTSLMTRTTTSNTN